MVKHLSKKKKKSSQQLKPFTIFAKNSILDVWLSSLYVSDIPVDNQIKVPSLNNALLDEKTFSAVLFNLLDH